jgi:hypothetical protein
MTLDHTMAGNFMPHASPQKSPESNDRRFIETPDRSRTIQDARADAHRDASGTSFKGAIIPQFTIGDDRMMIAAKTDRFEPTSGSAKSAEENASDIPNQNDMARVATGPRNNNTAA